MSKKDFPIFANSNIAYLDNASTTQKPQKVLDAMTQYYQTQYANTNRGAYKLGTESTQRMENGRATVQKWLHAKYPQEIIFTKGTTESINLLASTFGEQEVAKGDEVALLITEHHANLLPWQRLCQNKGATLVYLYLDESFSISEEEIETKITTKTKIVACGYVSNALGIVNPIEKIVQKAHSVGAKVVVDAAQAVAHFAIDVQKMDIDFLALSSHKMYGPMGIGVLYGKRELLEAMPPYLLGGDMVEYVYEQEVTFNELPYKFEAGTQNVAGVVGLEAAIQYIEKIGFETIQKTQDELMQYAEEQLALLPYVNVIGKQNPHRAGILSFTVESVHPHDIASILDANDVCIRAGNHCAQPLMRRLGINSTTRMSFGVYNTRQDVDKAVKAIQQAKEMIDKWT